MKALIFIEHDIIVRHFVQSRVFADLVGRHEVTFVFPEPGHKRVKLDASRLDLGSPYRHLSVHQERMVIWTRLFQVDQLCWRPGSHFAALRVFQREMIGPKATGLYTILSLPGIYQLFRRWSLSRIGTLPNTELDQLLTEEDPDVIIHPCVLGGVYINDLVAAAKAKRIPLTVIMNSWDNPSTKRAMVGSPDWLLVWGPQSKRHAIEFMGLAPERVVEFGAAQFDVYRGAPRLDREAFCQIHDIDPEVNILLYAGSSKNSDEFAHLVAIERAISEGELGDAIVVYRPHPWGSGGRDGGRILDCAWRHVRIESTMRAYLERVRAGDHSMSFPDYRNTHDVLSSVDALVSPLSTIILEGALHGKPVLCFLPTDETTARHFQLTAPFVHFEDMFNIPEFLVVSRRAELIQGIQALFLRVGDKDFSNRLRRVCTHFVKLFERPYGERFVDFVEQVACAGSDREIINSRSAESAATR